MKTTTRILSSLILLLCQHGTSLHAANNQPASQQLNAFAQHFTTFSREYPQEKVYLHFDNTAYYLGETMWFKAYVVTAERNSLSPLSKVLYIELVTPEGRIIDTKKLKIENGRCHGDIKFPTLNFAGFYEVRAYTRYMLNFGQQNYFSRVFPVYDQPLTEGNYRRLITVRPFSQRVPQERKSNEQPEKLNMTFYPEGGSLVAGLTSRVAFKAFGKEGESAPVCGAVYDESGAKVTDFESRYLGMGSFDFQPGTGRYLAKAQYQGKEYSFEVPQALPSGYAISVDNNDPEKMNLFVQKSSGVTGETLGLTISSRGKVYASDQLDMVKDSLIRLSVPGKMLPSGVIQITLYNASGNVLSERLAFVNHFSQMQISALQDKSQYQPFERVNMDFHLKDLKGNPVETSFSVSVRDASTNSTNPYSDNVLTNLLLSSEVKGYIENPGYYFESDDPARRAALELLMLTQGWSRYSWKLMAGVDTLKVKHPIEKELLIEGAVRSQFSKKKVENVDLSMILLADSTSQRGKCVTDKEGKFNFALVDFKGQAKMILETKQEGKRKEKDILLDRTFSPTVKSYSYAELNVQDYVKAERNTAITSADSIENFKDKPSDINQKLSMDKKNHLLKEVTVKGKKKEYPPIKINIEYKVEREMDRIRDVGDWQPAGINELLGKLNKYFVYGGEESLYKGNKKVLFIRDSSPNIADDLSNILSESLSNETVNTNAAGVEIQSNDQSNDDLLDRKDLIPRLEEIESMAIIEEENDILRICPQLIMSNKYDPGKLVLVILHCKKTYHHEPLGMRETKYEGFAYTKEFFQPNYDKALLPDEKDYRRTLYWNPDVKTDASGKATISFFNNSSCKAMNVSAETVTDKGVIGAMSK